VIKKLLQGEGERMAHENLNRQITEAKELETANLEEFTDFSNQWNNRIQDYRDHKAELISNKEESHFMEMQQLFDRLDKQLPFQPKKTSDLLNLIKIREHLVKNKSYSKAEKVQK
jgi:hypothetical protein